MLEKVQHEEMAKPASHSPVSLTLLTGWRCL